MNFKITKHSVLGSLLVLFLFSSIAITVTGAKNNQVREPAFAGSFYSADAVELSAFIEQLFVDTRVNQPTGKISGLVVPHAGYVYSAATAAAGYKTVAGNKFDLVVILAPSHRDPINGATIYPGDAYKTPLGEAVIDRKTADELIKNCRYVTSSVFGHRQEHAIEVQIPFVQKAFRDTKIIPVIVGAYDWNVCSAIGNSLAQVVKDKKVLFVASTDLYHGESYSECHSFDNTTLAAISRFEPQKLCQGLLADSYQACGGGPVVIMQVAAQKLGANKAVRLAHTTSGDVTGKKTGYIVGYGAVAVYQEDQEVKNDKIEYGKVDIATQKEFLRMARQTIKSYLLNKTIPEFAPVNELMKEQRGVFVTLTINGELRGCIGHHESNVPLYKLIPQMAAAAAFGDPRFLPLSATEFDQVVIKISVYLTNVYKINSLEEFKMGKHGIIMQKDGHSATYLPEVPLEAGWKTIDEEMTSLCRKAGLPVNAWKEGASFWVYQTQVFSEDIL